ncbi:hypothetical protein PIB30_024433 [Stylosanthes scabra]|uniref:RRM domain-containing protein n=1 Tax=Stylosanthes scabra TaxID=79078 RepID=A0ABU6V8W4_9FABA|nr:hypothetical protein [Stylosanthes scabra]
MRGRGRGVRRVVWQERGIHGEWRTHFRGIGADRVSKFSDGKLVTTFVDHLPSTVIKRDLFKKFGKDDFIRDIYISRRKRQHTEDAFAFVRFREYKDAMRAIRRLNGTTWQEHKLSVSMSRYRKDWSEHQDGGKRFEVNKSMTRKWVPVKKSNGEGTVKHKNVENEYDKNSNNRKEIQGVWSEEQKERLNRSLLGVCVKPIDFRKVMNKLLDEWSGPEEIESRDVGPYRCLITFSSPEIRDNALNNELLYSMR